MMPRGLLIALAMLSGVQSAHAHGIAGNRFFPGTLLFDDPAVADESRLPLFSSAKRPDEGADVVDNRLSWSFFRLLTPTLGVGVDSGWVHRNWPSTQRAGFDVTSLSIKAEVLALSSRGLALVDSAAGLCALNFPSLASSATYQLSTCLVRAVVPR
jgi:hypothetical protein